jgi:hypothetical protein
LEQFIGTLFEVQSWLDEVRNAKFWGTPDTAGPSPVSKAYAIATIHFPELVNKVNELYNVSQAHVVWIAEAAFKKLTNPEGFAADFPVTYRPFIEKMNEIIGELNRLARREFGPHRRLRNRVTRWVQRSKPPFPPGRS